MKFIVVTGGIASGKSSVVEILQKLGGKGLSIFDCDSALRQLYKTGRLSRDLVTLFGPEVLMENDQVNKQFLSEMLLQDPAGKAKLEELIHPRLMELCHKDRERAAQSGESHTYVLDIPLFYESHSTRDLKADKVCVVATSEQTQCARLMERDGNTQQHALARMHAQLPTQEKIERADVVFWNEGTRSTLEAQVEHFYQQELASEAAQLSSIPESIHVNDWRELSYQQLQQIAEALPKQGLRSLPRAELIQELCRYYLSRGATVTATGVLEKPKENFYALRDAKRSFRQLADDIYISQELVTKHGLRPGNEVTVRLRQPRSKAERYLGAANVQQIEGMDAAAFTQKPHFDKLTALIPDERLILEHPKLNVASMRVLDLITPLGKGQRALIVAPPRGGKTILLKTMAKCLRRNYPSSELLVLLLDERPEEVTDFEETVKVTVYASTFDEPSIRHAQLSDLVLERARRLVEQGKDVIILLDSLTRLARGYNANQSGGRIMSGGLGSHALEKPRKFFGAARKVEEGGSLTIVATCLIETESRMDDIIFEEFKGTGNMEIRLDRELAERRIFPAISIPQSGTRNDDRLYHPDEMSRVLQLRRQLAALPGWEGLEALLREISKTQNNAELLLKGISI